MFLVTTTVVWFLKKEEKEHENHDEADDSNQNLSILECYKLLLKIFKLPAIQWTVVILLTCKVTVLNNKCEQLKHFLLRSI